MRTIRNCNAAVVGGAGFLGSHLVNYLIEDRGCEVWVIDNLAAGRREFIHPKAKFQYHDITGSESRLKNLLYGCRFVFNYSALPYIPVSFARPLYVADVNFMGAMKVINAAQEAGAEGILQVSSAEIYGDSGQHSMTQMQGDITDPDSCKPTGRVDWIPNKITERGQVNPHSSYGVSKAAVDSWVQVRWREAKTPCIALRQFNCVGERETHPYIVPEIISQIAKWSHEPLDKPCTIRLGNNSFRDFLYAGDAVRIAVELLERGQFGEVYNLGSETGIKMYDLAKLIGKLMGFAEVKVERDEVRVRPWEIWHLQSCNEKLWNLFPNGMSLDTRLALNGLTPLEEALRRTIKWYEDNGCKWPWEK